MEYINRLNQYYQSKEATEHTYRNALRGFIDDISKNITIINEPKKCEYGMPDFVIKSKDVTIGYIETKDITIKLSKIIDKEQITRYRKGLDNLIVTNYLEFYLFSNEEELMHVKIAEIIDGDIKLIKGGDKEASELISKFLSLEKRRITSSKALSYIMANKSKLMRKVFSSLFAEEKENYLNKQYEVFKNLLLHDMGREEFIDIYVQTIVYGLLMSRIKFVDGKIYRRENAYTELPESNKFLRGLFFDISRDIGKDMVWIIDDLCEVYRYIDVQKVIKPFTNIEEDPIIHFYATYLAEYDRGTKRNRGVWYTPQAVVKFIVESIDHCLKEHFNLKEGIRDTSKTEILVDSQEINKKGNARKIKKEVYKVQLLDIATGTGAFTAEVIKKIYKSFINQQGLWDSYVKDSLLPRLNGFEILIAPYIICHLKLQLLLEGTGYKFGKEDRMNIYLTNSLERNHRDVGTLFSYWLAEEAKRASEIKKNNPVMVIYGNPPYNVSSMNKNEWIEKLMEDYKKGLNEKNINPLSDDYIKFIRCAEHYIERVGYGIVAMITNNSFIDGIIHREMRKRLVKLFDLIYIYDLHGNLRKQEKSSDGNKDENIFNIMQGVCILILVKYENNGNEKAEIHHFDSYGSKKAKNERLLNNGLGDVEFKQIDCKKPYYFFVPKDYAKEEEYNKFISLSDLFIERSSGIETQKNAVAISFSKDEQRKVIESFLRLEKDEILDKYSIQESRDWKIINAKEDISKNIDKDCYKKILYRPFDTRHTFYTGKTKGFMGRPRRDIMHHMLAGENIAIITTRITSTKNQSHYVFISKYLTDRDVLGDLAYIFPLYLYDDNGERTLNLNKRYLNKIAKSVGCSFEAKVENAKILKATDVIDYIYGILNDKGYNEKYRESLAIDFPRIPYPKDGKEFSEYADKGKVFRKLHLLEDIEVNTSYPESGSNVVEYVKYKGGLVFINDKQYFKKVNLEIWQYNVGSYQPLRKYLNDRKGRRLTYDEIVCWQKMASSISSIIGMQ